MIPGDWTPYAILFNIILPTIHTAQCGLVIAAMVRWPRQIWLVAMLGVAWLWFINQLTSLAIDRFTNLSLEYSAWTVIMSQMVEVATLGVGGGVGGVVAAAVWFAADDRLTNARFNRIRRK